MKRPPVGSLRAIGFWADPSPLVTRSDLGPDDPYVKFLASQHQAEVESGNPFLPDPRRIIQLLGRAPSDQRVLSYLDSGHVVASYLGYSTCRCCGTTASMGTTDVSDGTWVWPEGLSHYLRAHELPLPAEFLTTLEEHNYQVAPRLELPAGVPGIDYEYDFTFWYDWAAWAYSQGSR